MNLSCVKVNLMIRMVRSGVGVRWPFSSNGVPCMYMVLGLSLRGHEVVSKICDWLLNSSWDHFSLHHGKKKCKSDHGTWGPHKAYFQVYIIHCHGPTCYVMGEAKEVFQCKCQGTMAKKCQFMPNIFQKKKGRRSNMKEVPKTTLFVHILTKSTHPHFGAWSLLLVDVWFTPSQGPKRL